MVYADMRITLGVCFNSPKFYDDDQTRTVTDTIASTGV